MQRLSRTRAVAHASVLMLSFYETSNDDDLEVNPSRALRELLGLSLRSGAGIGLEIGPEL
jgi:hypothetical protein